MKSLLISLLMACNLFAVTEITIYGYSKAKNMTGKEQLYDRLFDRFNETVGQQEGIKVTYLADRSAIAEAWNNGVVIPADMIQVPDALYIKPLVNFGALAQIVSEVLESNIPAHLRDDENRWFASTKRYRVLYRNTDQVTSSELQFVDDLTKPAYLGKLCVRNADKSYSTSFAAYMIATRGLQGATNFFKAIGANSPIVEQSDMNGVIKSIHEGKCIVGLANTYYLGHLLEDIDGTTTNINGKGKMLPEFQQDPAGVHVGIKAFAVLSYSQKKEAAQVVLEWLSGTEAQKIITWDTHEHPVNPNTELSAFHQYVESFGPINENKTFDLESTADYKADAIRLMKENNWN